MINFNNTKFITSFASLPFGLEASLDEILFVGRSNCGKSSFINALTGQKQLAFTSSKPGYTKLLNYFLVDNKFYLVDAPGYGHSAKRNEDYEKYGKLMDSYLISRDKLKLVVFLMDSRRIPNEDDVSLYDFLVHNKIPFIICLTKVDKLNMSQKAQITKNFKSVNINIPADSLYFTSILQKATFIKMQKVLSNFIENK